VSRPLSDVRSGMGDTSAGSVDGISVFIRRTGAKTWRMGVVVSGCVMLRTRHRSESAAWEAAARQIKALNVARVTMGKASL